MAEAFSYSWGFQGLAPLERVISDGFVFRAHWLLEVTAEGSTEKAIEVGLVDFERPDGDLVPYAEITRELATKWVQDRLGVDAVDAIQSQAAATLAQKIESTTQTGAPWLSSD